MRATCFFWLCFVTAGNVFPFIICDPGVLPPYRQQKTKLGKKGICLLNVCALSTRLCVLLMWHEYDVMVSQSQSVFYLNWSLFSCVSIHSNNRLKQYSILRLLYKLFLSLSPKLFLLPPSLFLFGFSYIKYNTGISLL